MRKFAFMWQNNMAPKVIEKRSDKKATEVRFTDYSHAFSDQIIFEVHSSSLYLVIDCITIKRLLGSKKLERRIKKFV